MKRMNNLKVKKDYNKFISHYLNGVNIPDNLRYIGCFLYKLKLNSEK